jgi:DNA (cytosine-5)-methyltransferase 1
MKAESQCFRADGKANTLVNGTSPGCHNGLVEAEYTVRRLTPTECAFLQGFPTDWCMNLETENPSDEEIDWWSRVFEEHRIIMGTSTKAKSRSQIIKWLQNPYSDAAEYKMWGNGVALPCVCFVLAGIAWAVNSEEDMS